MGAVHKAGDARSGWATAAALALIWPLLPACSPLPSATSENPTARTLHPTPGATPSRLPPPSSPPSTAASTESCAAPEVWQVSLEWSGGLVGVQRSLEVSSSGQVVARDLTETTERSTTLNPGDIAVLTELLVDACPIAGTPRPPSCADCYEYAWSVDLDGRPVRGVENDVSLRASRLGPWIEGLVSIWQGVISGELGEP
jgi:hypothetical protein